MFRADAAFAKPEIYEALEERGVKYAIRIPSNDNLERDIAELVPRPVGRPSKKPLVEYKCKRRRETRPGTPRERRTLAEQKQTAGNLSQETVPGGAFRGIPEGCTQRSYMHAFGERFMLRGRANGR